MADKLMPNESLKVNGKLTSQNGKFTLILQDDGNLVLYKTPGNKALWASNTVDKNVAVATMQQDGNFVLYAVSKRPMWASNTNGKNGSFLILQDDGNLVIYQPNVPVWASGTNGK